MSRAHAFASRQAAASAAPAHRPLQPKLRIGAANDPLEREADSAADAVLRGETVGPLGHAPAAAQRECAGCAGRPEREQEIQRKCAACDSGRTREGAGETAAAAVAAGGAPLSPELRAYFEPRFGRDFSDVRIHTHGQAASAADAIRARAYTSGSEIAFASGEFAPSRRDGRRLIAHELAHVAQQSDGADGSIRRAVAATSSCAASVHDAPADPMTELIADDARAQHMTLGAANVLFLEALTFQTPSFGPSYVSDAYARRFGGPPADVGGFRNRFTNTVHATQADAKRGELLALQDRYQQLHNFLAGSIRYFCPGTAAFTLAGCTSISCGGSLAFSCPAGREIAICPRFWTFPLMSTVDQRGCNMIHEAVHMLFQFSPHGKANADERGQNSECYAAFAADIYGFQTDDSLDCTPLTP